MNTELYRINRDIDSYPCNKAENQQHFVAFCSAILCDYLVKLLHTILDMQNKTTRLQYKFDKITIKILASPSENVPD